MTSQVSTKVRLVRCPRCREVLAELPGVPLYQCGGCGTILQAKSRKTQTNNSELSSQVTDAVAKTQQDSVSVEKEATSSSQDLSSPHKDESLLDKDINKKHGDGSMDGNINVEHELQEGSLERENGDMSMEHKCGEGSMEYEHEDRRVELHEDRNVSDGLSVSPEVNCPEDEEFPIDEPVGYEDGKSPLGQIFKRCDGDVIVCYGDWPEGRTSSDGFPSSSEIEESTAERNEHDDESLVSPCTTRFQHETQRVSQEDGNVLTEVQNLPENKHQANDLPPLGGEHEEAMKDQYYPLENDEKIQDYLEDQNGGFVVETRHDGIYSSSGEIYENGTATKYAEPSVEVDDDIEGLCASRKTSSVENLDTSIEDSALASQSALNRNTMPMDLTPPDKEHLDHSIGKVIPHSGNASSEETMGTSPLAELSSELTVQHGNMVNSPTRRYYAYDGSESSYDGTDDQIPENISRPPRRKSKNVDRISTTEMLKKDGLRVNSMLNSEPEMNYWRSNPPSTLHGQQHYAMKGSHLNEDKFPETKGKSHINGNRMRLDEVGGVSRLPFTSRDFPVDHRTENPSVYHHNMLPPRPNFHLPDKHSYSVPDRMDLMRTVCELKDQLDRIQFPKVAPTVSFSNAVMEEKPTRRYYDQLAPGGEMFADSYRPAYSTQHNRANGWAERCNAPRMAFSGEIAHNRHQHNCSCLHCCPQDWHRSAQLPLQSPQFNPQHYSNNGYIRGNISSSSSPQHYSSSELSLRGRETNFDNQRRRDDEIKRLYLREKYHTSKTHLRPIAGGAPILACCHCSELLQLPADFLLFKKKYHQLRCNACSKILKFSLQQRTHIIPYLPDAPAPPPSEADYRPGATIPRKMVSMPHSSSRQNVEPVSCSEDYGQAFDRSFSTERDASIIERNRKKSSGSTYGNMEDRKVKSILNESQKKNKSRVEIFESVGSSSKGPPELINGSLEIEELPPSSNASLHRLMGYSTPSQVFKK